MRTAQSPRLAVASFDVDFDVDVSPQRVTTHHNNRGFGGRGTAPNDMGHYGTALWARDYETAALPTELRWPAIVNLQVLTLV